MATQTSLVYDYSIPTVRRMRAEYDEDYLFHESADCPIFDARPTLPQTREESSDQILDKLELAGRVPSKEKFRRMACNTFIYTGICPYNDRCVFLHDHRIKAENVKVRTTRQTKASNVIKDTFYWPDMTRKDVARTLDPQGLPSANQMYVVPEAFKCNPGNFHNRGLYSTWMHFVEFCVHNSPFYTVKRFRDLTTEPFFLVSGYRENPHVPGAKRLDSFIRLSLGRGVKPPPPDRNGLTNKLPIADSFDEEENKKILINGNGNTNAVSQVQASPQPPKLTGAVPKRRASDLLAQQITPDSISSIGKSFFGGGPPRQKLNAHAAHFQMPASNNNTNKTAVASASVPMLKKVTMNAKDAAHADLQRYVDKDLGLGIDIASSLDSLTEDIYDKEPPTYEKHEKNVSEKEKHAADLFGQSENISSLFSTAVTNVPATIKSANTVNTTTSDASEDLFSFGNAASSSATPLWLDSLSVNGKSLLDGASVGPFSLMNSETSQNLKNVVSGAAGGMVFDQWSPPSGLLHPDFALDRYDKAVAIDGTKQVEFGNIINKTNIAVKGNDEWDLDSLIEQSGANTDNDGDFAFDFSLLSNKSENKKKDVLSLFDQENGQPERFSLW